MGVYVVVADQFEQFSRQPNMLPYGALLKWLANKDPALRGKTLIAGQGLGVAEVDHAFRLGVTQGLAAEFALWRIWMNTMPAGRALSHKKKAENVLISAPEKLEDGTYAADLLLHADNELMQDHLTGQHVQGMVLTEACRQMLLAVTERFCLDDYKPAKRYFVLNEMAVRYMAFAFPLPAQVRYRVLEQKQPKPDRVLVHADMEVWQGDQPVSGMNVKFSVMDATVLGEREASLASKAIAAQVTGLHRRFGIAPNEDATMVMTEPIRKAA
ncbi:AfsA-related hotdog domain-containing protein [Variovorax sp. M-6]|uniref:AfsA-related hotdog domain-containing protein n=1 Tax=Variovorax sp. M-6 TaxID=3233041 RepID=UPI003F9B9714